MDRAMIEFDKVSIVFGADPASALPLMDKGEDRAAVQEKTGQVLGAHDCTLTVAEGEISVLMGLSGSGKSTLLRAVNGLNRVSRGAMRVRGTDGEMHDVARRGPRAACDLRHGGSAQAAARIGVDGVPELRAAALAQRGGERGARPRAFGARSRSAAREGPRRARHGGSHRLGGEEGLGAVGRHAAARGPRAGLRDRCADPADGRAVLRARSADPHAVAGRTSGAAGQAALHHPLREPRSRGGGEDRQHDHHHGGRAHRAIGQARGHRAAPGGRLCHRLRGPAQPAQRAARHRRDAAPVGHRHARARAASAPRRRCASCCRSSPPMPSRCRWSRTARRRARSPRNWCSGCCRRGRGRTSAKGCNPSVCRHPRSLKG